MFYMLPILFITSYRLFSKNNWRFVKVCDSPKYAIRKCMYIMKNASYGRKNPRFILWKNKDDKFNFISE
jgi:hypothetical protein